MSSDNLFHSAVDAVFQHWMALQVAVANDAAGPRSADIAKWMVSGTVQWFSKNKNLEYDEVEDFLANIVNKEFNVLIDDGSVTETSKLVCDFYRLCSSSKENCEAEIKRCLQALPKCDLSKCIVDNGAEPLENVDEEENIEQITTGTAPGG
jgi:ERCC4-related helicase